MIFLNLLPANQKKDIQYEKTNLTIIGAFVLFIVVLIIFTASLFYVKAELNKELADVKKQKSSYDAFFNQDKNKSIEDSIVKINSLSSMINKVNKYESRFSYLVSEIANLTPEGIKLNSININKLTGNVKISGNSKSRDLLLSLTNAFKSSAYFESVESPLSNLTSPENIDFSFDATLSEKSLSLEEK